MTALSVSFHATLKAMNTTKFQIHVFFLTSVKMAGTVSFLSDFPVNILSHLCTKEFDFRAYCRLRKSKIPPPLLHQKKKKNNNNDNVFQLDPKPRIFEIKRRNDINSRLVACQIMGGLYVFI